VDADCREIPESLVRFCLTACFPGVKIIVYGGYMKVLIVGAGAMGSRFAVALLKGGADVVLFDINKEHIDAINQKGLELHADGNVTFNKIPAVSVIDGLGGFTHLFIFTKSIHTHSGLQTIKSLINPGTALVTLQNGLGNIETIKAAAPGNPIIAGITNYPAIFLGPGVVEAGGSGITKLQAVEGADPALALEFAEVLHRGGMGADIVDNIYHHIWGKVAFNAAMNTITSLTGLSVGLLGASKEALTMAFNVAKDVALTARGEGIDLSDEEVCDSIRSVMDPKMSSNHYPSMFQDVHAGRKTEVETICGKVLEKAGQLKLSTPYLHSVYLLIRAIEDNYPNRKL
jgi:2-dehydropantoate 2-reductase